MMRLSNPSRERLKRMEGFRAKAYIPVPGDVPTIGYGFTKGVNLGDTMTPAEADARLVQELRPYEQAVWHACTVEPNQNEFDAMVLLCFNIGVGGFSKSTVLKCHNRGDKQAAARAFVLWNKSGGRVYEGLTRRRAEEAALYLRPGPDDASDGAPEPMPQKIDAESRMSESPINRAGVVAGGTAAVATVAETTRTIADVKYSVSSLGDWLVPVLLVAVVMLCGYVVWQRVRQRKEGWA